MVDKVSIMSFMIVLWGGLQNKTHLVIW